MPASAVPARRAVDSVCAPGMEMQQYQGERSVRHEKDCVCPASSGPYMRGGRGREPARRLRGDQGRSAGLRGGILQIPAQKAPQFIEEMNGFVSNY